MSEDADLVVFCDDQPDEVVAKVNDVLEYFGLRFEDTGEMCERIVYRIVVIEETPIQTVGDLFQQMRETK